MIPAKQHFRDMQFATLSQIQRPGPQTSTPESRPCACHAKRHRFEPSSNPPRRPTFLQPSRTAPAAYFETRQNPCACHAIRSLNKPPKAPQDSQFLPVLTSKSLSPHSVVQILATSWAADPRHHLAFRS